MSEAHFLPAGTEKCVQVSPLSECLCRPLTKAYQEVLRTVFMSSSSSPSGANRKKSMKDLQEEITNLYNNIRLFEKGTKFFSGESCSHCYINHITTIILIIKQSEYQLLYGNFI